MKQKTQRSQVNDAQRANTIKPVPRNPVQSDYIDALMNEVLTLVFGPAGTAKTFLASSVAAYLFLRGDIKNIYLTRPKVAAEEEWGFLPGTIERKTAPWAQPIMEILEECLGKARVQELVQSGEIAVQPFEFMRGRTFKEAFIILDEAQNVSQSQMELFLTRIGEDSRVVVNGDLRQSDIRARSGLAWALDLIQDGLPARLIEFNADHVERSPFCAMVVKAIERNRTVLSTAA
mgnify:CR=1 FL=1